MPAVLPGGSADAKKNADADGATDVKTPVDFKNVSGIVEAMRP